MNKSFPLIQYPPIKNGINANVLCKDKNRFNGKNPTIKLIMNANIIISMEWDNNLLGIIWSNDLQNKRLSKYHNTHQGVNNKRHENVPDEKNS